MDHVRLLALLDLVLGALALIGGLAFAALYLLGASVAPPELEVLLSGVGIIVGAAAALYGCAGLVAGALLLSRPARGAQILQMVIAVPQFFNMPLGTAFAAYSIWVVAVNTATRQRFEPAPALPWALPTDL